MHRKIWLDQIAELQNNKYCLLTHYIHSFHMFLFSSLTPAVVKDETPDTWDDDEPQEEEKEEKEKLIHRDKDVEFLFHKKVRDSSLDDFLQRDLQSKKSDPKYKEMLVSRTISIKCQKTLMFDSNVEVNWFSVSRKYDMIKVALWFVWSYESNGKLSMQWNILEKMKSREQPCLNDW